MLLLLLLIISHIKVGQFCDFSRKILVNIYIYFFLLKIIFTSYASKYNKQIRYILYIKREHNNEIREEEGHTLIEPNVNLISFFFHFILF